MTALSMSRMAVPYVALAAACGVALVFAIQYARREPPVDAKDDICRAGRLNAGLWPAVKGVRRRSQRRKRRQMR